MRTAWRIARRELRGGLGGLGILVLCLVLGVAALAAVGTLRASIEAALARDGAALLGGDAEVRLSYRFATPEERAALDAIAARLSETAEFRSLATVPRPAGSDRALTQVKAVDDAYPLVGEVVLDPAMPLEVALAGDGTRPGAVIERALAERLGLAPGDGMRLGTTDFVVAGLIESYPDNTDSFALGPITILRRADLEGSGLLGPGTLFTAHYRLLLPPGADLAAAEARTRQALAGSGARWRDLRDGAPRVGTFVERLGSFLILIGLSSLAVGGVGVAAAVRAYLDGKTEVIATLKTLGASRGTVFATYFLQIGALTLVSIAAGLALGAGVVLALGPLIQARLPLPAIFAAYPGPMAEAAAYGGLAALIFMLWPLARAADTRPASLFRDFAADRRALPATPVLAVIAGAAALLVGLAATLSGSPRLALWTLGGIAGAMALLALAAVAAGRLAKAARRFATGRPALRLALGSVAARRSEAASVVLSLGLGLSVLAAVGQIDGTLRGAILRELPQSAPSFFFVDIQPDQIGPFRERLAADPAVTEVEAAPMLRGIISRINDRPAREFAGDHWVIRGDRGVTYSEAPPEGTRLTAGEWWPADYDGPPLVSFSAEEAGEIGLGLGDTITVNILGREITATVASLREVDFRSAGIGFTLAMNPSALAGAPHSWIATVHAAPEAEAAILRGVGDAWPNITGIRIGDAIARAAGMLEGIAGAVRWGAAATLLTGLVVLVGAALAGAQGRRYEAAILKSLGASRGQILASFALRAGLLGLLAGLTALAAGIAGGWAVARFVLETGFAVNWGNAVAIVAGGVVATMLADLGFALRTLSVAPSRLLRAG